MRTRLLAMNRKHTQIYRTVQANLNTQLGRLVPIRGFSSRIIGGSGNGPNRTDDPQPTQLFRQRVLHLLHQPGEMSGSNSVSAPTEVIGNPNSIGVTLLRSVSTDAVF